ncbi:hypothetical protein K3495_g2467 [Podosphaera aphanis]|nr:hypothetical protein K3495_g2467 [Podosphaera aphanis]
MASHRNSDSSKNNCESPNRAPTETASPTELSIVVDELLNSLSNKFAGVSSEIFAKMDDMSRRLDNLESIMNATNKQNPK